MRKPFLAAAIVAIVIGTFGPALAVDIGGLNVPVGSVFSVAQIYENVPTAIGDTLAGYGKVDSINSIPVGYLCTGCDLTYQFVGYTVEAVSPTESRFTGGFITFYLGFGAYYDLSTGNAGTSGSVIA